MPQDVDIKFPPVWAAAGALNVFGDGWPYHKLLSRFCPGFGFSGVGFVSKTTTLHDRPGNMPLDEHLQPTERFPRSIWMNHRKGIALNAVGLSGPGARALLDQRRWQERTEPFQISFMAVEDTPEKRLGELRDFLYLLDGYRFGFRTQFVLQLNFSCPNVEHGSSELDDLIDEIFQALGLVYVYRLQAVVKLNALFPPEKARLIASHAACYGLCVSNTIPFRTKAPWLPSDHPRQIDWDRLFGKEKKSPLQGRGFLISGGLSGKPILPLTCGWILEARNTPGFNQQWRINACGGILHPDDVLSCRRAGATSISIGSVAFLRPWRVRRIIERAHKIFPT